MVFTEFISLVISVFCERVVNACPPVIELMVVE
jgi:hypothetical protein